MARKLSLTGKASGLGRWLLRLVTFSLVAGCAMEAEDLPPRPGAPDAPGRVGGARSGETPSSGGDFDDMLSGDPSGGTAPGGNLGGAVGGDLGTSTSIPSLPGEDSGVSAPVPWGNPGGGTRIPSLPGEDSGASGPRPWSNAGNAGNASSAGGSAGGIAGGNAGGMTGTGVPAGNFEAELVSALLQDNAALMTYAGHCAATATSAEVAAMCQYLMETRSVEMEWLDAWWRGRGGTTGEP
ncbi:hypothetical protein [Polyangium aurulentum]|uniref:hypothetical protein n=1 Tax=Polyangium aurulentum TaxID=2567896 RepID=UPI0010AEBB83|nr:hypothetical protein [Polyangium aurulentum]UQA60260.1 hypothetical protein E8A73_007220 [Polyangium aurulentum]